MVPLKSFLRASVVKIAFPITAIAAISFRSVKISGEVLGFRFPMTAMSGSPESPVLAFWGGMSHDVGDYGDLFQILHRIHRVLTLPSQSAVITLP